MEKINFLYARRHDLKSKFVDQFTKYVKTDIDFIDISRFEIPQNGINLFCVNIVLPKWLLESECVQHGRTHFSHDLPNVVLEALRQKKGYLLLDNSGEGPSNQQYLKSLHSLAVKFDFSPSRIIWVHQNLAVARDYEKWVSPLIIDRKSKILNLYWHSFLVEFVEYFTQNRPKEASLLGERSHWFLCLNNVPRPERLLILLLLESEGLRSKGLISFNNVGEGDSSINVTTSSIILEQKFDIYNRLKPYLSSIEKELPLKLNEQQLTKREKVDSLADELYSDTYFSIVTESELSSGHVCRFTEKSLKPFANRHPFIVFGNPGTLRLLRQMGFKTFDGLIDESYDDILDKEDRVSKAFEEVLKLTKKTKRQIHEWYESAKDILDHNQRNMSEYMPKWISHQMGMASLLNFNELIKTTKMGNYESDYIIRMALKAGSIEGKEDVTTLNFKKIGHYLTEVKDFEDAINMYKCAVIQNPNDASAFHRIAANYSRLEDYDQAIIYSLKSLECDPHAHWSQNLIGYINLHKKKEYFDAFRAYMQAFSSSELQIEYLRAAKLAFDRGVNTGGEVLVKALQDHIHEERLKLEETVSIQPNDHTFLMMLGLVCELETDWKSAYDHYLSAYKLTQKLSSYLDLLKLGKDNRRVRFGKDRKTNFISIHDWIPDADLGESYKELYPAGDLTLAQPKKVQFEGEIPKYVQDRTSYNTPLSFLAVLDNGKIAGENGAVITSQNQLIIEPSEQWGVYKSNGHEHIFADSDVRPPKLEYIDGTVAVLATAGYSYYHSVVNELPRLHLIQKAGINLDEIDYFLINDTMGITVGEVYDKIGVKDRLVTTKPDTYIQAKKLIVPSLSDIEYDYTWDYWHELSKEHKVIKKEAPKRLFISRYHLGRRCIENEPELTQVFDKYGFTVIGLLEELTFAEQVSLFYNADVIVSTLGSNLTSTIFCRERTKILELFSDHIIHPNYALSVRHGCDYYFTAFPPIRTKGEDPTNANIHVTPEKMESLLLDVLKESD